MPTNGRADGKVVIVTGSTRGLGESIACELAREGAQVVVTGRSADDGRRVEDAIQAAGGDALFVRADVNDDREAARLVDTTLERYGRITGLVNNAGPTDLIGPGGSDGALTDVDLATFRTILDGGLMTMVHCCRNAIPHMREAGGSIVNVSSAASMLGAAGCAGYTASKGAMNALSRQVAVEYGPAIRSNALVVGNVDNGGELQSTLRQNAEFMETMSRMSIIPIGERQDVPPILTYLMSDESRFLTGAVIALDGGLTAKM